MMKITGLSHIFKWENLPNWWLTKYFFAPLYTITHDFATGRNIFSSGKQPSGPVPFIVAPVADLLDSVAVQIGQRQLIGEGE